MPAILFRIVVIGMFWQLGADSFKKREAATVTLRQMAPAVADDLRRLQTREGAERRQRAFMLVQSHCRRQVAAKPLGFFPWLDMLPLLYPHRPTTIRCHLTAAGGSTGRPPWPNYRKATRLFILDTFGSLREAEPLLAAMRKRETAWIKSRRPGQPGYKPPP